MSPRDPFFHFPFSLQWTNKELLTQSPFTPSIPFHKELNSTDPRLSLGLSHQQESTSPQTQQGMQGALPGATVIPLQVVNFCRARNAQ